MKKEDTDISISFKLKITALLSFLSLVFIIGMIYANYLSLEKEVESLKKREEIACQRVNDVYLNLAKISSNIEWIKDSLKTSKERK